MEHISVLKEEAIKGLNIKSDGIYVDATLGLAGHSMEIHKRLKRGRLIAFDQDLVAIDHSKKIFEGCSNVTIIHSNFSKMKEKLEEIGITKVDGILFDLGVSSPQIDDASRGFSFQKDAKLDMRMDTTNPFSALNVVNEYSQEQLTRIFYLYGEEKFSASIAKSIIKNRPINTTLELKEAIVAGVPYKYAIMHHPERKIFQAIRIEVNKELSVLESVLPDAIDLLKKEGRIVVITFHSLEDRIVKQVFNKYSSINELVKGLPNIPDEYKPIIKLINKKPIIPSMDELEKNARSKSAKMRIIERI